MPEKKGHFPCPLCNKVFKQKSSRTDHHRKIHLLQRINCNHCGKTLGHRASLSNHKRKHCPSLKTEVRNLCTGEVILTFQLPAPSEHQEVEPGGGRGEDLSNSSQLPVVYQVIQEVTEGHGEDADTRKSSEPEVMMVSDIDNVDIRKEKNDLEKERDELDSQVVDLKRESKKQESLVEKLKNETQEHLPDLSDPPTVSVPDDLLDSIFLDAGIF